MLPFDSERAQLGIATERNGSRQLYLRTPIIQAITQLGRRRVLGFVSGLVGAFSASEGGSNGVGCKVSGLTITCRQGTGQVRTAGYQPRVASHQKYVWGGDCPNPVETVSR